MSWNPSKVAAFSKSFDEFLSRVVINSKERGARFVLGGNLYLAQQRMLATIWQGLAEDKHDFKFLKGRQAGSSTLTRILDVFWLGMHDGMQGAMVFDSDSHIAESRQEIEDIIDNLPWDLRFPKIVSRNRYGIRLSNQSRLRFMSAGTRESRGGGVLGRSSGLNLLHSSECCSWVNQEGIIALKNAFAVNYPDRLAIWESTARGPNAWKTMWEEAKLDDLNQVTAFVGWWANDTLRIASDTPRFAKYGSAPPTPAEAARITEVRQRYDYQITPEQLAWYRYYIDPNRDLEDDEPKDGYRLQDQPFTEEECWQLTGTSFFDVGSLTRHLRGAADYRFKAFKWFPGSDFLTSQLEPAFTNRDIQLKLWEEAKPNATYVVSADPAFGHSARSDHSAIQVLSCYADCLEQVSEYASTSTYTHQLAWLIWALVGYFGSFSGSAVQVIIEINGPGEAVWREFEQVGKLIRVGYLAAPAKEAGLGDITRNCRNYIYTRSDSMHAGHNYHWKMQEQLKIAIMERLRDLVHHDGILIRSQALLEEMSDVTRDGDKIGAEGSARDDRTVALAMGVRAWEERLRPRLIAQGLTRERDQARRQVTTPADRLTLFNQFLISDMFKRSTARATLYDRQSRLATYRASLRQRRV